MATSIARTALAARNGRLSARGSSNTGIDDTNSNQLGKDENSLSNKSYNSLSAGINKKRTIRGGGGVRPSLGEIDPNSPRINGKRLSVGTPQGGRAYEQSRQLEDPQVNSTEGDFCPPPRQGPRKVKPKKKHVVEFARWRVSPYIQYFAQKLELDKVVDHSHGHRSRRVTEELKKEKADAILKAKQDKINARKKKKAEKLARMTRGTRAQALRAKKLAESKASKSGKPPVNRSRRLSRNKNSTLKKKNKASEPLSPVVKNKDVDFHQGKGNVSARVQNVDFHH